MTRLRLALLLTTALLLHQHVAAWSFNSPTNTLFKSSRPTSTSLAFSDENHGTGVKIFRGNDDEEDDSMEMNVNGDNPSLDTPPTQQDRFFQEYDAATSSLDNGTNGCSESASPASDIQSKTKKSSPKVCESLKIDDQNTESMSLIDPITYQDDETELSRTLETLLKWTPVTIPIVAFVLYDPTALLFSTALQNLSADNTWVAVDGGQYQAKIITPAINGIVVQAIAILFAVLIGNTITNLRSRQIDISLQVNQEATQLRILSSLLGSYPVQARQICRQYLLQYTSRLIAEGHETTNVQALEQLKGQDTKLFGILQLLNELNVDTTNNVGKLPIPTLLLDKSYETTFKLLDARSKRLTALASTFPALHYVVIVMLAVSMCAAFLMETDQDILVFLNAIQLRLLWTSLVGTFCALGVVLYDLGQPFRGSYQVTKAVSQLYSIRSMLKRSIKDGNAVAKETSIEMDASAWDPPKAPSRKESVNGSGSSENNGVKQELRR